MALSLSFGASVGRAVERGTSVPCVRVNGRFCPMHNVCHSFEGRPDPRPAVMRALAGR